MAYDFDETNPGDSDYISDFPTNERAARLAKKNAFEVDHELTNGFHDKVTLNEQGADPDPATGDMAVYCKDTVASGQPELYYQEENAGDVVQITYGAKLVLPVFSGNKAARDALTKIVGMQFVRTDIHPGAIDVVEGAAWVRRAGPFSGQIALWSGSVAETGDYLTNLGGWCLCRDQGTVNGVAVPDLRGQFIVGYSGAGDYASIGDSGGSEDHALTAAESSLPAHTHVVSLGWNGNPVGTRAVASDGAETSTSTTTSAGGGGPGDAHENRPPFYTLAYIIFADVA